MADHDEDYVVLTAIMGNDCNTDSCNFYLKSSFLDIQESYTVSPSLHPNPTTGLVVLTGEDLRQAEVVNMLGQKMLCVQGKGKELQIDMTALPAGIYFVAVTDKEGRKCVRKVVKE